MINIATDLADVVGGMTNIFLKLGLEQWLKTSENVKEEFCFPYLKAREDSHGCLSKLGKD